MEDLESLLGVKYTPEQQTALTEMARSANDTFRVFNPTEQDYFVLWDVAGSGGRFLVPGCKRDIGFGAGQAVHPRYIAFKFFKEIANIILSAEMQYEIDKENERRRKEGKDEMGKTLADGKEGELHYVMTRGILPNRQDKLMELLPKIILGIEKEWGMETITYKENTDKVKWQDIMAIVNRPVSERTKSLPDKEEDPEPIAKTNDPLVGVAA